MQFQHRSALFITILALFSFITIGSDEAISAQGQTTGPKSAAVASPDRATIGVMAHSDFIPDRIQPQKGEQIGLPDLLADRILEHLSNSRRFTTVDRTALRRVILEQRFGRDIQKSYLDRTLDKAIDSMGDAADSIEDGYGGSAEITTGGTTPPGRIKSGSGAVGTTGALADFNDLIKDYQDLGSAVGADYLVLGKLEKLSRKTQEKAIPYSDTGRTTRENLVDARLRLRVIAAKTGTVVGAASIRTKLSETLFEGRESDSDKFTFYDHLGELAASKILDITFPARIVSLDPLIISRGSNDGAKKGDIYRVEREGKALKDANGLVIAHLKREIGRVEVISPQETIAIVRPISGSGFENGDLAGLDIRSSETFPTQSAEAAPVPLAGRTSAPARPPRLPRVAIGLVKSGSTAKTGKEAKKHTPIFTDSIISRLTQTRRFQLIDRQEVDQLLKELEAQAMAGNRDMASPMGTLKGADYLVYGSLASFGVEEKTRKLPNSSRLFKQKIGHAEGNMRIVDARSGDIMESRKISIAVKVDPAAKGSRTVAAMADAYAEQVVLMLMNSIYPIKVAHVGRDGMAYINRGDDGGLYVGETLDAFRPGPAIIDPDTGVQLGFEETVIGQVRVTEVEDARSKGELLEGSGLAKGDLLKRTPQNKGKRATVATAEQKSAPERTGGLLAGNRIKQDKTPLGNATIAMGVMRYGSSANTSGIKNAPSLIRRMSDDMILKLVNTNRFSVMERQAVDQILDEKAFDAVASGGDIEDRLRELEGADYLIHGEVVNFYITIESKKVPYLDRIESKTTGIVEGTFRIVDVHTGRVISAEKVRVDETIKLPEAGAEITSKLMDRYTTEAVALIVSRLYPIKVLGSSTEGIVYLNRGADGGLQAGTQFDVMRPGPALVDTDTGRSFGSAETRIALIEVIAVEANRSRARIVSGSRTQSGDILRKPLVIEKKPEPQVMQPAW